MKIVIVTTTINIPIFLESYTRNFKEHSVRYNEITFIIVGDLKSPNQNIKDYIKRLAPSFTVEYWDVDSQRRWITETFGSDMLEKAEIAIPYNSIRRRNIGYLRALELGADVIITVDDDNYAGCTNWLHEHLNTLHRTDPLPTVSSANRIVNPCHILKFSYSDVRIYSRGYPFSNLFSDTFDVEVKSGGKVALNMGLWTDAPDVDAYTNILYPGIKSLGIKEGYYSSYALSVDNYMPINTQNTSFIRDLTPAFYDVRMDDYIYNIRIDRYDDIWGGLFALKIMHRLNYRATFGIPLTEHKRNIHDFTVDLRSELLGASLNNTVYRIVMNADISSKSIIDGYLELVYILESEIKKVITDYEVLKFFGKLTTAMRIWLNMVDMLI